MKIKLLESPILKHYPHSNVVNITWDKRTKSWEVKKQISGQRINMGLYKDLEQAKLALFTIIGDSK